MTESLTPICDLIERLMSRGLSQGQSLEEARIIESTLAPAARGSRSAAEKREIERVRKAAYREKMSRESQGQKDPAYILKEVVTTQSPLKKESKKESTRPAVPRDKPDDWPENFLDAFWEKYPAGRKSGKKAVLMKLTGIRKRSEVSFTRLMEGVQRYVASKPDPRFTKAPEVWLNKGCWDDEYQPRGSHEENRGNSARRSFAGYAAELRYGSTGSAAEEPAGGFEPFDGHRDPAQRLV